MRYMNFEGTLNVCRLSRANNLTPPRQGDKHYPLFNNARAAAMYQKPLVKNLATHSARSRHV